MTIRWGEVEVRLTTHDAGGITEKDIAMAERLDDMYEWPGSTTAARATCSAWRSRWSPRRA